MNLWNGACVDEGELSYILYSIGSRFFLLFWVSNIWSGITLASLVKVPKQNEKKVTAAKKKKKTFNSWNLTLDCSRIEKNFGNFLLILIYTYILVYTFLFYIFKNIKARYI